MTRHVDRTQLVVANEITVAPEVRGPRACTDRDFGLPPALHVTMVCLFLGFVTVLCAAFATPGLLIPYVVFVAFIVAYFAVPGLWSRMKPEESRTRALGWYEFRENGIDTATGRTGAAEATTLVLLLPSLIFCWAVAVAVIGHTVR